MPKYEKAKIEQYMMISKKNTIMKHLAISDPIMNIMNL